jgi:HAD superfamily phosphatase
MAPECLLFDLDGVVVDVTNSYRRAIIDTAETFGVSISNADVARAKSDGGANDDWELTARLCRASGLDVDLSEVTARFEAIYQGTGATRGLKENELPMIDAETLGKWRSTLPLGIVTGRPATDAHDVLERFDLRQFFETVVTRDDAPMKPDPAPVQMALANLGAESGWMLGDTPDDLTAARLAGVVPIAVRAKADGTDPDDQALFSAAIVLNSTIQLQEILDVTLN